MAEPAGPGLTWPDFAVLAASLAALIVIGGAFSREQRGTEDFFLARRRIPWWAACLSFLATEISAVTIISVPATAYAENWEYGQFFRSEEHTSELQSLTNLVCRLLLDKKK